MSHSDGFSKNAPGHIGPKLFAPNRTAGGLLDGWAALGRDSTGLPVPNNLLRHPKGLSQLAGAAADSYRFVNA